MHPNLMRVAVGCPIISNLMFLRHLVSKESCGTLIEPALAQSPVMQNLLLRLFKYLKRQLWSLIVAYMVGLHNFYYGDNKSADDIMIRAEMNEVQESNRLDPPDDSSTDSDVDVQAERQTDSC